ncbi:MAG: 4-alpha-glucanotransferase [Spirochaetes bacterium GWB1_59_5]|nr:MAG: 4-alpha-glucanotransferase [Spirochaetes bacterium GWB1_59_5]
MRLQRSSGILLHPTSLPGPFGIGDIGPQAARFVAWLASAGQRVWQVLPLGPTGYGDSPYAPFSSFAGNELLISPELLARDGWLTDGELEAARFQETGTVDYGAVIPAKRALVRTAAERLVASGTMKHELAEFKERNAAWLDDYALFRDIKREYDELASVRGVRDSSWNAWWPKPLARRDPEALAARRQASARSIALVEAEQYLFSTQWSILKGLAAANDVKIIGDLPIFVAMDSADAWSRPELFRLDATGKPSVVAGVPPDYFSADGQLWGNPLYAWERHEADGFAWWIARIEAALSLYDMVRIDHFRGLAACWAVPAGEKTARNGSWEAAPGAALLSALVGKLGAELPIVAEDLGFITEDVTALRIRFGLPGMRILQFGFDAEESGRGLDPRNPFLPHNYAPDCVAYTGTHDNDTLAGWLDSASSDERAFIEAFLGYLPADTVRALLREAMKSAAGLAVFPMQDALGLGSEARMNTPSTIGGNWSWRLAEMPAPGDRLARELASMAWMYGRSPHGGSPHGGVRRT